MTVQPEQLKSKEAGREEEGRHEEAESIEKKVETPEALNKLGGKVIKKVKEKAGEIIKSGVQGIQSAIESIGGGAKDLEAGETSIAGVQKEITTLSSETQDSIRETSKAEKATAGLKDEYSPEQLAELRSKTKEDYGDGLVSKCHKGAETLEEHEVAQRKAYEGLNEKIELGVVKPDAIQSEIMNTLKLRDKPKVKVEKIGQVTEHISIELKEFVEKGFIKEDEASLIQAEAEKFAGIYQEAYPDADPQQIFEVARDNARKLAYQTERDKQVFSGSDHGTRHVLEGNMNMADKMFETLGDKVSAKDKVIIHQIIVDHDLGYTVGVAQAEKSFAASKDHPIFSTKFIEANQEYYKQMFGDDGYEMIHDGILMHSYPKSEYNTPTDPEKGFNPDVIRSITSTVDALGVTAETKCPAFFRQPDVIHILQKVKLFAETHDGNVAPEALEMYKNQLRELADKEPDEARKKGFYNAIDKQFNPVTVEMTLGQYAGVLKDIKMVEQEGKMVPQVSMDISRAQALLGDLFGDKISTKAFVKAMEDFGVPKEAMADIAQVIRQMRKAETDEEKKALMEKLKYSSDKAVFEFAPKFEETTPEVEAVMEDFMDRVTIRDEIRTLVRALESPELRSPQNLEEALAEFHLTITEETDEKDLIAIMEIENRLRENINSQEKFGSTLAEFKTLTTKREREFMGI